MSECGKIHRKYDNMLVYLFVTSRYISKAGKKSVSMKIIGKPKIIHGVINLLKVDHHDRDRKFSFLVLPYGFNSINAAAGLH